MLEGNQKNWGAIYFSSIAIFNHYFLDYSGAEGILGSQDQVFVKTLSSLFGIIVFSATCHHPCGRYCSSIYPDFEVLISQVTYINQNKQNN